MRTLIKDNEERLESDLAAIDNLIRKGWTLKPEEPNYDEDTESLSYDKATNSYVINKLSESDILLMSKSKSRYQILSLIQSGYNVQPENITLALGESDRNAFSQMLSLIKEAIELGLITNGTPQTISDKSGQKHTVSTLRFRQIMVGYGFYFKSLWDELNS